MTVSGYTTPGNTFFAFAEGEAVASVSVDGTPDANGNGTYTVTVTPAAGIDKGKTATIYVGMGVGVTTVEAAKSAAGRQEIMVTVSDGTAAPGQRESVKAADQLYVPVIGLAAITQLSNPHSLVLVFTEPGTNARKAIGWDGDNWLFDITELRDDDGRFAIADKDAIKLQFYNNTSSSPSQTGPGVRTRLQVKNGSYFSTKEIATGAPFTGSSTDNKDRTFIFANGEHFAIGRREDGNGDSVYLGYKDGKYVETKNLSEALVIDVYMDVTSTYTHAVRYHAYDGSVATTLYYSGATFTPTVPTNISVGGKQYTLLGWTTSNTYNNQDACLLSDADATKFANLYVYDKDTGHYKLTAEAETFLKGLIPGYETDLIQYNENSRNGSGGSYRANDFDEYTMSGTSLDLYPIYIPGGYNNTVTADGPAGSKIVVTNVSTNETNARWLGYIKVEIYKDGVLQNGDSSTLFFHYNSDNMVDIVLDLTSANGAYVINGAVAEQAGGSSDGISYSGNHLSPTGGALDNVVGGSTVKIYMSTRYTVEFYLDGVKKNSNLDGREYSTTGSLDEFQSVLGSYGTYDGGKYLAQPDGGTFTYAGFTPAGSDFIGAGLDSGTYESTVLTHGVKALFGYLVKTYPHEFTIPSVSITGQNPSNLVNGTQWVIKTSNNLFRPVSFDVTENVGLADDDGVFRFYASTWPRGSLTVSKAIRDEASVSLTEEFTFRIYPEGDTHKPTAATGHGVRVGSEELEYNVAGGYYTVTLNYPTAKAVTVTGLFEGSYRVEEVMTGLVPGLFKTPASQTVTVPEDNTAAVTVTNEIQKGSLTVTKDVVEEPGATPDAGKKFEFKLSLSVPNGITSYTVNVNGTPFTVGAGKTVVTFELADGETCKIDGIPYGVGYTLSETLEGPDEHFYASSFGGQSSGTINATTPAPTVTCTNTHHAIADGTGALHLFKYTQGQTEQTDFTFSVTFTYEGEAEHRRLFEDFAAAQGVTLAGANTFTKTYTVKKGDNLLITNIPDGTAYSVSEVTAEMTGDKEPTEILAQFDNDSAEATDLVSGSYKTTVVNGKINGDVSEDHDHDDVVFYNRYLIDLTIKKVVEAAGAGSPVLPPNDAEFVFVLEFNGFEESELDQLRNVMYITDAHGVHTYEDLIDDFRDDNKVTLYVTTSTPAVIYKVPAGRSHYNITEIETFDADEVEFSINGTTTQGDTTGFVVVERSTSEIIFTNRYTHSVGKIEITKNLAGTGTLPAEDTEFSFTVQLTGRNGQPLSGSFGGYEFVNGTATVKVKAGQTLTLDQIPYGTTYTITEVESSRGDNVSVSVDGVSAAAGSVSAAGTIDAESITVVFTNEYEDTDPPTEPPTDPTDPPTDPTDPPTDPTDPPTDPTDPPIPDDPDEPKPPTPPTLNGEDHFGYIVGYPGEVYVRPNSPITRAELVSILFRLLKDEVREQYRPEPNRVYFTDVNRESWYSLAVGTLANMGIISGYGDGTFRPDRYITRAEMAVIVSKFFENSENTYFSDFTDVPQDAWYARYVAFAKSIGLMVGNGDGTFGPDTRLSRAEAMAVFNRLLGRTPTRDSFERVAGEMKTWADNANPNLWYYADVQEATNSHEFVIVDGVEVWTEITEMIDWTKLNESYQYGN